MEGILQLFTQNATSIFGIGYKAVVSVGIVVACYVLAKWSTNAIRKVNERIEKVDTTLLPVMLSVTTYAIYTLGIIFILDIFGVNTTSIIALLGAAGIAIGFALKDTLGNIAAGIMLLFLRPFKAGDFIEYGGTMGTVMEVNLFTTVLHTYDGLYVSTPNGMLWGSNITNFSRNGKRMMNIVVGIAYHDSLDKGLDVLRAIADSEPRFLSDPAPQVMVTALADSAVNIQLRGWATTADYWQTYWDLNKRVKEEIDAAGLTIPFPQRTLHMISAVAPTKDT